MMRRFRTPKRVIGQLFLWQVLRQEEDEFLNTTNTLFTFSLTLLFIAIAMTVGLVWVGHLSGGQGAQAFKNLDHYGLFAVFALIISTLLSVLIKGGSFERMRAPLIVVSFVCILTGLSMISTVLVQLVL